MHLGCILAVHACAQTTSPFERTLACVSEAHACSWLLIQCSASVQIMGCLGPLCLSADFVGHLCADHWRP